MPVNIKRYGLLFFTAFFAQCLFAQPIIRSFTPVSGSIGTSVTITGAGFNTALSGNIVYFGGVRANVTAATANTLTITVPDFSSFQPFSVLNTTTGLVGYSYRPFVATYNGGATSLSTLTALANPPANFATDGVALSITMGDLDGDGRPDMVTTSPVNGTVSILRNTSEPGNIDNTSFENYATLYAGQGPAAAVLRDMNGDGRPDVIVSGTLNYTGYIYWNQSTPGHISFAQPTIIANAGGVIDAVDVDGDGLLDLLVATDGSVSVWRNTTGPVGGLAFAPRVSFGLSGNASAMAIADIDGDGRPDIITANGTANTITVLRNMARPGVINDSSMAPYLLLQVNSEADQLAVGDIDGDNKPDIVFGRLSGIAILKNLASAGTITTSSFGKEVDFTTGGNPTSISIGDMDGDGRPDIAIAALFSGTVSLLKNITSPGNISASSLAFKVELNYSWSPGAVAIADIDGNGKPELLFSADGVAVIPIGINTLPPVIAYFSPDSARAGSAITITGHHFSGSSSVELGDSVAASYTVVSDSVITAVTGNGATGNVSVTTSLGTSSLPGFHFVPRPDISAITPSTAGRGDTVTLSGKYLTEADTILFGGVAPSWFKVLSDTSIQVVISGAGSSGNVILTTPFGKDTLTGFNYIKYPLITFFTPIGGAIGDTISIHGAYLSNTYSVNFGGTTAQSFTVVSDTLIRAVIGGGAAGKIYLSTPSGLAALDGFTYLYPPPVISSFAPLSGPAGTTVIIMGNGFDTVAANNIVHFGWTRGFVSQANRTSLTVTVPAGATYQPLTVTTHQKTAYSYTPFILTFPGGGTITSGSFTPKGVVGNFSTFAMADVDDDGKLDFITYSNNLSVIRNTSTGANLSFAAPVTAPDPLNYNTDLICIADLDGDGKPDFLTEEGDHVAAIGYRNTSSGGAISLGSGTLFNNSSALGLSYISTGDLNGDGRPDIASAVEYEYIVSVLLNTTINSNFSFNGSGTNYSIGYRPGTVVINDFDGDGKTDIVVQDTYTRVISVFKNTGVDRTVSFGPRQTISLPAAMAWTVAGDLDGDGKPDLAITTNSPNQIAIYRNTSTGGIISFADPFIIPLTTAPGYLTISDLDGDGHPDLAVTSDWLSVFRNTGSTGNLSFADPVNFAAGRAPGILSIGDINGDGRPDIVVRNYDSLSIFINQINVANTPILTSYTPGSGAKDALITLRGKNFTGTTSISFGGAPAGSFTVVSDTVITATIGQGATGLVSVTTSQGIASLDSFTYSYPAPAITSFTPVGGEPGTAVLINGTNLGATTAVRFGGVPATSFNVITPNSISAVVGLGASGSVAVATGTGTDSLAGFTFIPPMPAVTSFAPANGAQGATITITGSGFTGTTGVSFGGAPAISYTVVSPTVITAVIGAGASGNIMVTTPGGTAVLGGFTFFPPLPTVLSFSPASGPSGTLVTIIGSNLNTTTAVQFGNIAAASFKIIAKDTLQAIVGAGATGWVNVNTPYGAAALPGFTFTAPYTTLTSFNPSAASTGDTIIITGNNLAYVTGVSFGGTDAASFYVYSNNTIKASVGAGASGNVVLITPNGPVTTAGFIFNPPPPVLYSFSPGKGASGAQIKIDGNHLGKATAVSFGGVPATSFSTSYDDEIFAYVGKGKSGDVTVTTPDGIASLPGFIYVPAPPHPVSFSPASGTTGTTITIKGADLSNVTSIVLGYYYQVQSFTIVSDSVITAVIGDGFPGASEIIQLIGLGGDATLTGFTFISSALPAITSFTPTRGTTGNIITLTGTNFTSATAVSFGGIPAASFTVVSSTTLTAEIGTGATGDIIVITPAGTDTISGFTYISPEALPRITSFSPTSGATGTMVAISGLNFTGATAVSFGGTPASSFTVVSMGSIEASIGTGASGNVVVSTRDGSDTASGFIYFRPSTHPKITSFAPASATTGSVITIIGSNFTGTTAVSFGGMAASSFSLVSSDTIKAIVGAGASGNIIITTPLGKDTIDGFTYILPSTPVLSIFKLLQFTGSLSANQPKLQWQTRNEGSISYYIVQYSPDSSQFSAISNIAVTNRDTGINNYTFVDPTPRTGVSYYQLQIQDTIGVNTYSNIISIQMGGIPRTLMVYPNPANDYIMVTVPDILVSSGFQLTDIQGKTIKTVQVDRNTHQVKIDLAGIVKGVYKLVWSDGTNYSYQTVLIVNQ